MQDPRPGDTSETATASTGPIGFRSGRHVSGGSAEESCWRRSCAIRAPLPAAARSGPAHVGTQPGLANLRIEAGPATLWEGGMARFRATAAIGAIRTDDAHGPATIATGRA